jgi:hypothetical protein
MRARPHISQESPMTLMPLLSTRRAAAFLALAAIAATFLLAGVAAARTSYPSPVRTAFRTSCVKAALAQGGIGKADATAYCNAALVCIESKLSLAQFTKISSTDPVVRSCEKAAAKKVFA